MTTRNRGAASLNRAIQQGRARQLSALNRGFTEANDNLNAAWSAISDELGRIADDLPEQPEDFDAGEFTSQAENALNDMPPVIAENSRAMEAVGAAVGTQVGAANLALGGVQVAVTSALINRVRAGINYVDSAAFQTALTQYGAYHAEQISAALLAAIATGENPRSTAQRIVSNYSMGLTDALRMTRTTQIYSAREGNRITYAENGVTEWIWSANLGSDRTCMGCVAMHGSRHPITETLNDHHLGRCAAIPVTPRWEDLGFTGGREPVYQTGPEWFMQQSDVTKLRILGPTLYQAWQDGQFSFTPDVIVTTYANPIFGVMRRPRTVGQIIGRR